MLLLVLFPALCPFWYRCSSTLLWCGFFSACLPIFLTLSMQVTRTIVTTILLHLFCCFGNWFCLLFHLLQSYRFSPLFLINYLVSMFVAFELQLDLANISISSRSRIGLGGPAEICPWFAITMNSFALTNSHMLGVGGLGPTSPCIY